MAQESERRTTPDEPLAGSTAPASGGTGGVHASVSSIRSGHDDVLGDQARLNALHRLNLTHAPVGAAFDDLVNLVASMFGVAVARIHLLDDTYQWVMAAAGRDCGETMPARESVCQYTIRQDETLVIPDLAVDEVFANAPLELDGQRMRFYAGAPLRTTDGHQIGVLCLLDAAPCHEFRDHDRRLLARFADLTAHCIELRGANAHMERGLARAVDEDALTGLGSRPGLLIALEQLIDEGGSGFGPAVIEIRPGRVDEVRRGHGSSVANYLLRDVAARLSEVLRPGEYLARPDDDAFVLGIPATARGDDATLGARAEAIVEALQAPFQVAGEPLRLLVSAGVAACPEDGLHAHELLDSAHEAAVRAIAGRHAVESGDRGAMTRSRERLSLEGRLRRAVAEEAFTIVCQPVVDLQRDNRTVGAEALVRWVHREGGAHIGPDVFIPLAEELELIHTIGLTVFEQSCRHLAQWRARPQMADLWLAVNLSPVQLRDKGLPRRLVDIAAAHGLPPGAFKLEVTESALVEDFDVVARVLEELAEAGFALALDDFGTGHSSLGRLINLPFDVLKVDRSFVRDSPDGVGAAVVTSLIHLSRRLGMQAVGEGIETAEHEAFLRRWGYELGQGYHYSKPLAPPDLEAWLGHAASV